MANKLTSLNIWPINIKIEGKCQKNPGWVVIGIMSLFNYICIACIKIIHLSDCLNDSEEDSGSVITGD